MYIFFFFKQKTAYEMRISDWSSDVCSSDLQRITGQGLPGDQGAQIASEVVGFGGAAGFLVQMAKVELPAVLLLAAVLAHQAIQPTLDATRQPEIDRKSTRLNSSH